MTDKVILGLPFINLLYPFITKEDGITTSPFGQPVKFSSLTKLEQTRINLLKENYISRSVCIERYYLQDSSISPPSKIISKNISKNLASPPTPQFQHIEFIIECN